MRWALIGASTIAAQFMINAIRQNGGEILYVVSGSADHAKSYAGEHDIPNPTTDLSAALSDGQVDAVYISTTNEKHLAQAMAAIEAGKHVICEKPLAMSVADAGRMVAAADQARLAFATNHHLRCSGSHRAVRDLIVSGRIGRVLSMRIFHAVELPENLRGWRINSPEAGGGVIPDITVHNADVTRFILGEDPHSVVGQMVASGLGEGVEDSSMSVWSMPSGAMVFSHESFTHPYAGSGFEVHGTEGSIFAKGVMTQRPVGELELVTADGRETVSYSEHDLYVEGVRRFVEAANGTGTPAASGWDGVKSLAVAMAVRDAAQAGRKIEIDYGPAK